MTAMDYCHLDVARLLHTWTQLFWVIVLELHTITPVKNSSLEWGGTPETALDRQLMTAGG